MSFDLQNKKIYIAGHNGMVGNSLVKTLNNHGCKSLILKNREDLDLLDQGRVFSFLKKEKPDMVIVAAARVGGIQANDIYRADFIYENLQIQNNLIHGSHLADVDNLIFLGSSCIYPKMCKQPIKEEYLLSGYLEETNEPYAIAKIAGLKLCESYMRQYQRNYFSIMPCNLYGPGDSFDLDNSHVLPALLRKIHEAKINMDPQITIWGTGEPKREFLHVDDLAEACVFIMNKNFSENFINVGPGYDISILELVDLIKEVVGYDGQLKKDLSKPDGTPRKLLDVKRINKLGWQSKISLRDGIKQVYEKEFLRISV